MKKRILIVLAALTMLLCVPIIANAASVDDLTFDPTTGTITDCNEDAEGELVIPEEIDGVKVTSIGEGAFYYCTNLTSVTIPDSVTSIGFQAFTGTGYYDNADNWENNVLHGVLYIGDCLIEADTSGTYDIKDGTRVIADRAFSYCDGLTSVNIPSGVTNIGECAFYYCKNLTSAKLPDGMISIGNQAFYDCNSLISIKIPSVTSIGDDAFHYCTSLISVELPDNVTNISEGAFADCKSLTSINIPDSVTSISENTFYGCGRLNIDVDTNNQNYCDIDGVLFTKDKKTIVTYAKDELQPKYIIPNGVTSIGKVAFYYCESLTDVKLPDSVTNIDNWAFRDCRSLTNINIPDSVTSIGDEAFYYCKSLTNITIPDSVTSIGDYAFYNCSKLTGISIPNSVTDIGRFVFYGCNGLTSVTISDSVTSIGGHAFDGCTSLTNINIPNGVTSIGWSAFDGCESLTSINIPDSVTRIDWMAFHGCSSLTDVYYSGTEREWKLIMIDDDNDNLLNATIHFLGDPLEVQPVEPEADVEANKITIPVTVTDAERAEELNDVRLYIAEYDADGRLTNVTFGEKGAVEGDTIIFTADIPDAEHYKIMLWDGNNAPLMDAVDSI